MKELISQRGEWGNPEISRKATSIFWQVEDVVYWELDHWGTYSQCMRSHQRQRWREFSWFLLFSNPPIFFQYLLLTWLEWQAVYIEAVIVFATQQSKGRIGMDLRQICVELGYRYLSNLPIYVQLNFLSTPVFPTLSVPWALSVSTHLYHTLL